MNIEHHTHTNINEYMYLQMHTYFNYLPNLEIISFTHTPITLNF